MYKLIHIRYSDGKEKIIASSENLLKLRKIAARLLGYYKKKIGEVVTLECGMQWQMKLPEKYKSMSLFSGILTINEVDKELDGNPDSVWYSASGELI
jgi:hypothetical protein